MSTLQKKKNVYKRCNNAIQILNEFKDVPWHPKRSTVKSTKNNNHDEVDTRNNGISTTATTVTPSEIETETIATDATGDGDVALDNNYVQMDEDNNNDNDELIDVVDDDVDDNMNKFDEDNVVTDNDMNGSETSDGILVEDSKDENGIDSQQQDDSPSGDIDTQSDTNSPFKLTLDMNIVNNQSTEEELDYEQIHPAIKTALSCYCSVISNELSTHKMVEIALECIGLLISNRYVIGSTMYTPSTDDDEEGGTENNESEVMYLINCICDSADHVSDAVQTAAAKALLALMTSPVCGVYEAGMLKIFRTVFHIYLVSRYDSVKKVTRAVLLDILRSVFLRMEAYDAMSMGTASEMLVDEIPPILQSPSKQDEQNTIFASRFHNDSYLLFRALCKLSAKLLPEDSNDASSVGSNRKNIFSLNTSVENPMATNTKILSLRLILAVFENCGPAFRDGEKFIDAVQNVLCASLVKNCMSNNPHVAHLSLKIFLLLVCDLL